MKTTLTGILIFASILSFAGSFNFKLDIELVNHLSPEGAIVTAYHNGEMAKSEKVKKDGDVKLDLEEGLLYEVWISKAGYTTHVIHNVHDKGDNKFDVMLYVYDKSVSKTFGNYEGTIREFDDVKKMVIPEEHLAEKVTVVNEDDLEKSEIKRYESLQDMGDDQEKAQKDIDKYTEKLEDVTEDISELQEDIAGGKVDALKGEKKVLKYQKCKVKYQGKLDKAIYF